MEGLRQCTVHRIMRRLRPEESGRLASTAEQRRRMSSGGMVLDDAPTTGGPTGIRSKQAISDVKSRRPATESIDVRSVVRGHGHGSMRGGQFRFRFAAGRSRPREQGASAERRMPARYLSLFLEMAVLPGCSRPRARSRDRDALNRGRACELGLNSIDAT